MSLILSKVLNSKTFASVLHVQQNCMKCDLNIYYNTECTDIPQFDNSELSATENISRSSVDGRMLLVNGSRLTFTCVQNYVTNVSVVECGVGGKWTPEIYCYPG